MGKNSVFLFHKEENSQAIEKIIIALKDNYDLVSLESLEELLRKKQKTKNICHLSFDDGDKSFYKVVFPLLKKHNIPASVFVSPEIAASNTNFWFQEIKGYDQKIMAGIISTELEMPAEQIKNIPIRAILKCLSLKKIKDLIAIYQETTNSDEKAPLNMNSAEIIEIDRSGLVTVGAHTLNHPILSNEDDSTSYREIAGSIKNLAALLGHPVNYFAYPNGCPGIDYGLREMDFLKENNVSLAFSAKFDYLYGSDDLLNLPRLRFPRRGFSLRNPTISARLFLKKKQIDLMSLANLSEIKRRQQFLSIAQSYSHHRTPASREKMLYTKNDTTFLSMLEDTAIKE